MKSNILRIGNFIVLLCLLPLAQISASANQTIVTFSKSRVLNGESFVVRVNLPESEMASNMSITLITPSNTNVLSPALFSRDSGSVDNSWRTVVELADDAATGTWSSLISYLDGRDRRVNLIGPKVQVENPATIKAQVRDIELSKSYLTLGETLTVTAGVTTSKGVRSVRLILISPTNRAITFDQGLRRVSGTNFIGVWQITVSLPEDDLVGNWSGRVTLQEIDNLYTTTSIPNFEVETLADVKSRQDAADLEKSRKESLESKALEEYLKKMKSAQSSLEKSQSNLDGLNKTLDEANLALKAAEAKQLTAQIEAERKLAEINSRPASIEITATKPNTIKLKCIRGKTKVTVFDVKPKCPKGFKKAQG